MSAFFELCLKIADNHKKNVKNTSLCTNGACLEINGCTCNQRDKTKSNAACLNDMQLKHP